MFESAMQRKDSTSHLALIALLVLALALFLGELMGRAAQRGRDQAERANAPKPPAVAMTVLSPKAARTLDVVAYDRIYVVPRG